MDSLFSVRGQLRPPAYVFLGWNLHVRKTRQNSDILVISLEYRIKKHVFSGIEMGGNDFLVLAILSLLPCMSGVLFPFHVEHAFLKVLQLGHCNVSFLEDGFRVLRLLNLQYACLEGGLEKRSVVCFSQREVWQKMLAEEWQWLPYCTEPCSEYIQQCSSDKVAFHLCRREIAQGKVGMTVAFTWALL